MSETIRTGLINARRCHFEAVRPRNLVSKNEISRHYVARDDIYEIAPRSHPTNVIMTAPGGCILVVAAVPQELQDFRLAPLDSKSLSNGVDSRQQVRCLVTGMGQRAGEAVRQRLSAGDVGLVVSTGFAGGIRPGFEVGDLVMASEVIHASSGERNHPDPSFFGLNGLASVGLFITVERPLSDPQAKAEAGVRFGAIAVDMETTAVAQSATQAGVAWVALRAILDPMELPLQISSPGQALRCLASPGRWKEFSGFLRTIRTASRSLADGLHCLLEKRE